MKQFFAILAVNIVAIILLALAFYMIHVGVKGYGWVILAALLVTVTPKKLSV